MLRPFLLGLSLALVLVLVVLAAEGYHNARLYWLSLLPVVALYWAAMFTPPTGSTHRSIRGALGFVVCAMVGSITYLLLHACTEWFRGLGGWIVVLIVLHAAVPGGAAAAADSPGRGLALVGGFTFALCVVTRIGGAAHPGYMLLLVVGTLAGVIVNTLDRGRPRSR